MSRRSTKLLKAALSALHFTRTDELLAPFTRGDGVIFTLHQVRPEPVQPFEPNRILKVTPEFLERAIRHVLDAGFDVVSLDEAHFRLTEGERRRPFACFTFDDAYKDNREHAYPIFRHYRLPFGIYVPTDYPDGRGELWWLALERAIARIEQVSVVMHGAPRTFRCVTPVEKDAAYHAIYWWLRQADEAFARAEVRLICAAAGYDASGLCGELIMGWDEIRELARDPLVTFGAHTRGHLALARLDHAVARAEIEQSVRRMEHELGRPCHHFAYPYGDAASAGEREFAICRELGLRTAVTTRKGVLHARDAARTCGLPRVSLNGDYQDVRYLKVLLSGVPFALGDAVAGLFPGRPAAA